MPENSIIHGSCICGKVELTIPSNCQMTICHCMSCRKASGSTHSGNFSVDEKDLQIMGQTKIYVDKGISGKEVYRHFCGDCGSPAYTKTEIPGPVYVKIGQCVE
ncbi:hypothetical protein TREMEDRAFT_59234 [Tremella mesenterica DSM 1558]|uniref:uncharacterized protein n=1 Tax=Tremella mesenterica (strain ATCC 24925 / CBS 8224 / DSM 1558 / NBRC 9311 / NRRL Y-6157 / RJB 2259-6 / UBC 559-6) TaxID=578456 RepID=UPI0003F4A36E|nr:uncharacterized protein TREMEDRAFT_59234 [Tremella mesenterica DSM 1558]EIW73073.1 hypothetical protein TREMEDRAFT_59234 [Tremella mesenterica DSM 1558]